MLELDGSQLQEFSECEGTRPRYLPWLRCLVPYAACIWRRSLIMLRNNMLIAGGNLGEVGIGLYHTGSLQFLILLPPRSGQAGQRAETLGLGHWATG